MAENEVHNPIEIQRHLSGVDYPASKDQLVETARRENAPEEVCRIIEHLPGDEFRSPADVSKAIGALNR